MSKEHSNHEFNLLFGHHLHKIEERLECIMSAIQDQAAREQANFTATSSQLDVIVTGIKNLDDLIQTLQNSQGQLGPGDQAALDAVEQASTDLVTKVNAISTAPPVLPSRA